MDRSKGFWCLDDYQGETSPIVDGKFAPTNGWLCDKLNELHEENQELKQEILFWKNLAEHRKRGIQMIEKRFKVNADYLNNIDSIIDNETGIEHDYLEIEELLNNLAKENKELKKEIETGKEYCNIIETDLANCADSRILLQKENQQLKSQLYYDEEEGVCNICKHHYLIKDNESEFGYYNSRCKKGHYECARVSLKYCEDFEKELKGE